MKEYHLEGLEHRAPERYRVMGWLCFGWGGPGGLSEEAARAETQDVKTEPEEECSRWRKPSIAKALRQAEVGVSQNSK